MPRCALIRMQQENYPYARVQFSLKSLVFKINAILPNYLHIERPASLIIMRRSVFHGDYRLHFLTYISLGEQSDKERSLIHGLRKHSLVQIDQAREETRHWKAEFGRLEAEHKSTAQIHRQSNSMLENDVSAAR